MVVFELSVVRRQVVDTRDQFGSQEVILEGRDYSTQIERVHHDG